MEEYQNHEEDEDWGNDRIKARPYKYDYRKDPKVVVRLKRLEAEAQLMASLPSSTIETNCDPPSSEASKSTQLTKTYEDTVVYDSHRIYVKNFPFKANMRDLIKFFEKFGRVSGAWIPQNRHLLRHKGHAFVTFADVESTLTVINLPNSELNLLGHTLHVQLAFRPTSKQVSNRKNSFNERIYKKTEHKSLQKNRSFPKHVEATESGGTHDSHTAHCVIEERDTTLKSGRCSSSDRGSLFASTCQRWHSHSPPGSYKRPAELNVRRRGISLPTDQKLPAHQKRSVSVDQAFAQERSRHIDLKHEYTRFQKSNMVSVSPDYVEDWAPVQMLPDDVLMYTFSFLCLKDRVRIGMVCHRWHTLSLAMWRSVKSLSFNALTDALLKSFLLKCGNSLQKLDISGSPYALTSASLLIIGDVCPNLRCINLNNVRFCSAALTRLSQKCTKLQSVSLENCYSVDKNGLWSLFHNCRSLKYVNLTNNRRLKGKCFFQLRPMLQCLVLNNCSNLTDEGISNITRRVPNLQELYLKDCVALTDHSLTKMKWGFTELKKVSLAGIFNLTESHLYYLTCLLKLEYLDLSLVSSVTDNVMASIGKHCKLLSTLDLSSCLKITNEAMLVLSHMKYLTTLRINYLDKVTDVGIIAVANAGLLKVLEIRGCPKITNEGVCTVANSCLKLAELDISGNILISNKLLYALIDSAILRDINSAPKLIAGQTSIDLDVVAEHRNVNVLMANRCIFNLRPDKADHITGDMDDYGFGIDECGFGMDDYDFDC